MSSKAKFHLLLGATFVLGLVLAFLKLEWLVAAPGIDWLSRVDDVINKVGDALLIAPILALAVDQAAKRELLKEFAKDVSSHIIGRQLPETMREYIRAYLDVEFLRDEWHVTYEISPWEKDNASIDGYVQLVTKSVYTIHNLTTDDRTYMFRYEVEDSWFPHIGETRITHVSARPVNGSGGYDTDMQEDRSKLVIKRSTGLQWFEDSILIPAQDKWQFVAESTECFRDSSTSPPFSAYYAVKETNIAIRYPKSHFTVDLTLTFGDITDVAEPPTQTGNETTWRLTKPILPGQGFVVTWRRKPSAVTTAAYGRGAQRTR
jgi:hypothetical protein